MSGGVGGGTGGGDGGGEETPGCGSTIRWVPVICSRVNAVLTSCTLCAGSDAGAMVAAIIMRVRARAAGVATSVAEPASAGWNAINGGCPTTGPQRTVIGWGGGAGGVAGGLWGGGAGGVAGGLWGAAATVWMFRANRIPEMYAVRRPDGAGVPSLSARAAGGSFQNFAENKSAGGPQGRVT